MISIILLFGWWLYSTIEGYNEGNYWHLLGLTNVKPANEHILWTMQRIIVGALFELSILYCLNFMSSLSLLHIVSIAISLLLSFPFFHDGADYTRRHELDNKMYPKKWFDQSTTSTAWTDKLKICGPILRTGYLIISIAILILIFLNLTT